MAKVDKEFQGWLNGLTYAAEYAKAKGLDELNKEVRRRNYSMIPPRYTDTQVINTVHQIAENTYTMMLTVMLYALHDEFGFGPERLVRAKSKMQELTDCTFDLDYMGEHYISMGDYAEELCEKYGPLVDITKVKNLQSTFDRKNDDMKKCDVYRLIEIMESDGYADAAEYIRKKVC